MPHVNHHTTDPGVRAYHIAAREAEKAWSSTGNYSHFSNTLVVTEHEAKQELLGYTEQQLQPS